MRVEWSSRTQATATTRRSARSASADQSFAESIPTESESAAATNSPQALSAVDGLFVLQEISEELTDRRRAAARGNALLDRLEDLRVALLTGTLPRARLEALRQMAKERGPLVNDPKLAEILSDIELRVAVELAKLETPG